MKNDIIGNMYVKCVPLKPHLFTVKLRYAGYCVFFFIPDPKQRLYVLVRTALTSANNLRFKILKKKNTKTFRPNILFFFFFFFFSIYEQSVYYIGMFS